VFDITAITDFKIGYNESVFSLWGQCSQVGGGTVIHESSKFETSFYEEVIRQRWPHASRIQRLRWLPICLTTCLLLAMTPTNVPEARTTAVLSTEHYPRCLMVTRRSDVYETPASLFHQTQLFRTGTKIGANPSELQLLGRRSLTPHVLLSIICILTYIYNIETNVQRMNSEL
jgi:hypothetical protein